LASCDLTPDSADPLLDQVCGAVDVAGLETERRVPDNWQAITECGAVDATESHVHVEGESAAGSLAVEHVQDGEGEQVRLSWSAGPVTVGTDLTPGVARKLAEQLQIAVALVQETGDEE